MGFPGGSDGKEFVCNAGDSGLIPWRREWLPTPVFLPGEFHGYESEGWLLSLTSSIKEYVTKGLMGRKADDPQSKETSKERVKR